MPHESLGDFLSILEDAGELVRVRASVDSALEIAEITRRAGRAPNGGPALFFESVRGSSFPVVTNVLGSETRLCRALGVRSLDELTNRLKSASREDTSTGWLDAFKLSPFIAKAAPLTPRLIKQAPCQQIVKLGRDVNLWELPIPRSWPDEPQPVITLGQVLTRCPQAQERSVELVPVQLMDQQRLAIVWPDQAAGLRFYQRARDLNQQLPVAMVLGGHAASPLVGLATLPAGIDPMNFSGLLQSQAVELTKCRTSDLEVPAQAEIVIEGMLDPLAPPHPVSSLALSTGFYSGRACDAPVLHVTAVTHRANPIFPAQIFDAPPSEETWMRRALDRLFLPWLQAAIPNLIDYHRPAFGGGRSWLFARIRKRALHDARTALHALWGHPLTLRTKYLVIVDDDVDLYSPHAVWFALSQHVDPGRDVITVRGATDEDDFAGEVTQSGHKLGIDATRKWPAETPGRGALQELAMTAAIQQQVTDRWAEFGIPIPTETPS